MYQNQNPKVSLIIPVYNTEKYLEKCLESVLEQSYKNLEIIIVNDCATDNSQQIIDEYLEKDSKIKCIKHEKNKGLFHARITGVEKATGDYIAFLDSDDHISIDWIRLLVKKAIEEKADMVIGNTICEDENHWKYVFNASYSFTKGRESMEGEEVYNFLLDNEGMCFSFHTVWNKLYSKEIWEKSIPHFKGIKKHLIMTEDVSFSSVLYYYTNRLSFSNHDGYFYFRNANSSTMAVKGLKVINKNVDDLIQSFSFVKEFMKQVGVFEQYEDKYTKWKARYFRWWSYNVEKETADGSEEASAIKEKFLTFFEEEKIGQALPLDSAFDETRTTWNHKLEDLKERISDSKISTISFDIFDTLLLRPFLEPSDIYTIMQKEFEECTGFRVEFKELRALVETECRKKNQLVNPEFEDVSLDEIYEEMMVQYDLSEEQVNRLKKCEIDLELKYCKPRNTGKELYELAKEVGKRVILISDMYLTKESIELLLEKNGYTAHDALYVSSDKRALKATGKLFEEALKDEKLEPSEVLHIGDNWTSDVLKSQECGMQSGFIPKTQDILFNTLGDSHTGDSIRIAVENVNSIIDFNSHMKSMSTRCLYAIAANELFDNPFIAFHENSEYNGDPYLIGVEAFGMHVLGILEWIIKNLKEDGYDKIHFLARDGYFVYQVYEELRKINPSLPEGNYLYASRKSLISANIRTKNDIYCISQTVNIYAHTPKSIVDLYGVVLDPINDKIKKHMANEGIAINKEFANPAEFKKFADFVIKHNFNQEKADKNFALCQQYFRSHVGKNDVIFDLGYSGSIQASIVTALGFSVNAYYIHSNGEVAERRARQYGFDIKTYYDFSTSMSGILNEFVFSDYNGSCIGYHEVDGSVVPVIEDKLPEFQEKYVVEEIHRGAKQFIKEYYKVFETEKDGLAFRTMDTSLQFEKFLFGHSWFDRDVFKHCYLEDEYYAQIDRASLRDHWWWQINHKNLRIPEVPTQPAAAFNNADMEAIYADGVFIGVYKKINKCFPLGSKRRELIKKIAGLFC